MQTPIQRAFGKTDTSSSSWGATVSYRTYQELLAQGIPANPYEQQKMLSKPKLKQ